MRLDLKLKEISLRQVPRALCQQREGKNRGSGRAARDPEYLLRLFVHGKTAQIKPEMYGFQNLSGNGKAGLMTYNLSIPAYGCLAAWA